MWPALLQNRNYSNRIKSLMTSPKIIPCVSECRIFSRFYLLYFVAKQIRCEQWTLAQYAVPLLINSRNLGLQFQKRGSELAGMTIRLKKQQLYRGVYIFLVSREKKKPTWNTGIVNLLQFHSDFLTSCALLCHLWDFSRHILLFNKSLAKKNSFSISPLFYYCVAVWEIRKIYF